VTLQQMSSSSSKSVSVVDVTSASDETVTTSSASPALSLTHVDAADMMVASATPTMSPSAPAQPWLVLIDLQQAFAHPDSPWCIDGFHSILPAVRWLIEAHAPRVIATRYVPPHSPQGSWVGYFERNRFALHEDSQHLWDIVPEVAEQLRAINAPVVNAHTFGKWNDEMKKLVGPSPSLVLAGVSTDCCVLSTALAAVDGGCHVRVATEACMAAVPLVHHRALDVMAGFSSIVDVTGRQEKHIFNDRLPE